MPSKVQWQYEGEHYGKRCQARATRSEIIVLVHDPADKEEPEEWGMPKSFGLHAASDQAAIQTKFEGKYPKKEKDEK